MWILCTLKIIAHWLIAHHLHSCNANLNRFFFKCSHYTPKQLFNCLVTWRNPSKISRDPVLGHDPKNGNHCLGQMRLKRKCYLCFVPREIIAHRLACRITFSIISTWQGTKSSHVRFHSWLCDITQPTGEGRKNLKLWSRRKECSFSTTNCAWSPTCPPPPPLTSDRDGVDRYSSEHLWIGCNYSKV